MKYIYLDDLADVFVKTQIKFIGTHWLLHFYDIVDFYKSKGYVIL